MNQANPAGIFSSEALKEDYAVSIDAYYLKDWQGYDMEQHSHRQMEIMYVLSGGCTVEAQGRALRLKRNEFILLDSAVAHGLHVGRGAPCRIMNIEFTLGKCPGGLSLRAVAERYPLLKRFLADGQPYLVYVDTEEVQAALHNIIRCMDAPPEGRGFELELYCAELLMALARLHGEGGGVRSAGAAHVRKAIWFMDRNYFRDIGVGDVSGYVGIAEGYLSRLFRQSSGQTLIEYLTELRIKKARMLQEKTELPLTEISGYVGVPSRQYFNELFRKHTGLTPGEYRKACAASAARANPGCM